MVWLSWSSRTSHTLSKCPPQAVPRCRSRPARNQPADFDETPTKIHVNHRLAPRWNDELHEPEDEENDGLMQLQLQVHQQQEPEKTLQNSEDDFLTLKSIKGDWLQMAGADHEEDRDHRRENAPLIDVRGNHV